MRVIGLTGGTGSGKSSVSAYLSEKNVYVIDCDKIAHEVIQKGKDAYFELLEYFGEAILDEEREINRRYLGSIIFGDSKKIAYLNQCTHKYILKEVDSLLKESKAKGVPIVVIDAALLIEAGLDNKCDDVWAVYASQDVRLERIMKRDGISREVAAKRIASQLPWSKIVPCANRLIYNDGDFEKVKEQISKMLEEDPS